MSFLHLSDHADGRLRQRGVRASDVALVVTHGTPVSDGYLLRARDVAAARPCKVRRRRLLAGVA